MNNINDPLKTKIAKPHPDVDRLIDALPESVCQALADLDAAPDHVAETTIGLMPFGHRALLEAVKVTRTINISTLSETQIQQIGDAPQRVKLTDWGRRVISACATWSHPNLDETDLELDTRAVNLRRKLAKARPVRRS